MIGRKDQINTEEVTTRSLDDFYDKPAPASQFFQVNLFPSGSIVRYQQHGLSKRITPGGGDDEDDDVGDGFVVFRRVVKIMMAIWR
jgi:hypothetical protein